MKDWASRKAAQRAVSLSGKVCEVCGVSERLQRHHHDYSKPTEVTILCQNCHVQADIADGTRKTKQMKSCKLCGAAFMPTHSTKHNLCGPACRSEMGRINAFKRWRGDRSQQSRA